MQQRALGEEAVGDPALVQQLDRAGVDPAAREPARSCVPPLENDGVHSRQPQLAGEHQPGRPAPDNHHIVHVDLAHVGTARCAGASLQRQAPSGGSP